jgi:hypothetical protein
MTEVTPEELTALKNVAAVAPRLMAILAAPGATRTDSALEEYESYGDIIKRRIDEAVRQSDAKRKTRG